MEPTSLDGLDFEPFDLEPAAAILSEPTATESGAAGAAATRAAAGAAAAAAGAAAGSTAAIAPTGSSSSAPSIPQLVIAAIGFGCFFCYTKLFSNGFDGIAGFPAGGISSGTAAGAASGGAFLDLSVAACFVCLVILAVFGYRGKLLRIGAPTVAGAGLVAAVTSVLLAYDGGTALGTIASALAGVGCALLMFVWCTFLVGLARRSPMRMACCTIVGLFLGGALETGLAALPALPSLMALTLTGLGAAAGVVFGDPGMRAFDPAAAFEREQLRSVPWFSLVMFFACGTVGYAMFQAITQLTWETGYTLVGPAFIVGSAATVALTVLLVLLARGWTKTVWAPLFALVVVGLLATCLQDPQTPGVAMSFFLPAVFCYRYLSWLVFPCLLGSSRIPPMLGSGVMLAVVYGCRESNVGALIARSIPGGMQSMSGVACIFAIVLMLVLALALMATFARGHDAGSSGSSGIDELLGVPGTVVPAPAPVGDSDSPADGSAAIAGADSPTDGSATPTVDEPAVALANPAPAAANPDLAAVNPEPASPDSANPTPASPEPAAAAGNVRETRLAALARERGLTDRECEIAVATAKGYSSTKIAGELFISSNTVRFHQKNVYAKLGVHSKQELIDLLGSL